MNPIEIEKDIRELESSGVKCSGNPALPPARCSASRLEGAIEDAKRKAVDELNALDWHEGDLRKWNIVERAIRSVLAVTPNVVREPSRTHDTQQPET